MARPVKEIDQKIFESLCEIQCTQAEICSVLDVTDKTLGAWCKRTYGESFSEIYPKKAEAGKTSLRRAQWRLAKTNATMAIFLGKQYLGQRDERDLNITQISDESLAEMEAYFDEAADHGDAADAAD